MAQCLSCGIHISDGWKFCSMCYGDIDYGKDGYYRNWAEQEDKRQKEKEEGQNENQN